MAVTSIVISWMKSNGHKDHNFIYITLLKIRFKIF